MVQKFGGDWTKKKLDVLACYAQMYTTALKRQNFQLHYIDAFAGGGDGVQIGRERPDEQLSIFPTSTNEIIKGSAQRLSNFGFAQLYFIESNADNVEGLKQLTEKEGLHNALVISGDANQKTLEILGKLTRNDRVLLFLDPFGLQVKWATLEAIAEQCVYCDVWYLFPFHRINASIPNKGKRTLGRMKNALEECLGLSEEKIIGEVFDVKLEEGLFGDSGIASRKEFGVEKLFVNQLQSIFKYVHNEPLKLKNSRNGHIFSLVLCSNNPHPKAHSLIEQLANAAMKIVR